MKKLDLHKLNDEHVKSLINDLKYPTTHIDEIEVIGKVIYNYQTFD